MKNILIPTNYNADTLEALRISAAMKQSDEMQVTLLSASHVPDSIIQLLFLSQGEESDIKKSKLLVKYREDCRQRNQLALAVNEHHQYGMSRPIMSQLLERFKTELVVIPFSMQQSKSHVDQLMLKLLTGSEVPLLFLPSEGAAPEDIHRALFLDDIESAGMEVIQNLPFHVIRQSMVKTSGLQSVNSMINNFRINVIVLTKGNQRKFAQPISEFNLPVLTV